MSNNKVNSISQHILTAKGNTIPIQTLRSIPSAEIENTTEVENRKNFDNVVHQQYGDSNNTLYNWVKKS